MAYVIGNVTYETVTIASGGSLSTAVDLQGKTLIGITLPSSWTAANLTFQDAVSASASYVDVYDADGTEYLVTAAASRSIPLDPAAFAQSAFLKVRSGTGGAAVNQGGDRSLILKLAEILA